MFQGLSIHYYSVVDGWAFKGSATKFNEHEWFETMRLNLQMDNIITRQSAIMDRYDPQKTKGMIVDEWGNWFNVEPGTNPGFPVSAEFNARCNHCCNSSEYFQSACRQGKGRLILHRW